MTDKRAMELYVHIPFCVKKCAYCDFLSGPSSRDERSVYTEALIREIQQKGKRYRGRPVSSVFIGGGTPSLLEKEYMEKVLSGIIRSFSLTGDAEFSIEANPGTLNPEKLELYREYGINRLSLGLQSVFDDDLKMLGRIHTYEDFLESYRMARAAGFSNINVDLISAIPGQTIERWRDNLRRTVMLGPEHISAYSLIIEEGTPFYEQELDLPDEDSEYEMYEETKQILGEFGYSRYEISNYSLPGRECRHNVGYWRRREYLGLGLGAASLEGDQRYSNTAQMQEYLRFCGEEEKLRRNIQNLSEADKMEEFMFLGLRMTEGVSEKEFQKEFGIPLEEQYGTVLKRYEDSGHMMHQGDRWRFTGKGIHVSNRILSDFLLD